MSVSPENEIQTTARDNKNVTFTDAWFPEHLRNAQHDSIYDDFDLQSERLLGFDQEYIQLSAGAFQGRFSSTFLGADLSVHIEAANQSLEQRLCSPPDQVTLGLALSKGPDFRFNGQNMGREGVMISAPNTEMEVTSPAGGVVMAICIDRDALLRSCPDAKIQDFFANQHQNVGVVQAPKLAQRLREDVATALENTMFTEDGTGQVGTALLSSITAQFSLQNVQNQPMQRRDQIVESTKRYLQANSHRAVDFTALAQKLGCSQRSIQLAFARHGQMRPNDFLRSVRLNLARRAILLGMAEQDSIGDLAARFGFWNWSRFSALYKQQFGEPPSATRQRAIPS